MDNLKLNFDKGVWICYNPEYPEIIATGKTEESAKCNYGIYYELLKITKQKVD